MSQKIIKFICGIPYFLSEDNINWEVDKNSDEYKRYKEKSNYQLEQWLLGNSIMNDWSENPDYWESCPDFSNEGSPIWPLELRQKFIESSTEVRYELLVNSLSILLNDITPDIKTYIADDNNLNTIH